MRTVFAAFVGAVTFLVLAVTNLMIAEPSTGASVTVAVIAAVTFAVVAWLLWPWIEHGSGIEAIVDKVVDEPRRRAARLNDGSLGTLNAHPLDAFVGEPDDTVVFGGGYEGKRRAGAR